MLNEFEQKVLCNYFGCDFEFIPSDFNWNENPYINVYWNDVYSVRVKRHSTIEQYIERIEMKIKKKEIALKKREIKLNKNI